MSLNPASNTWRERLTAAIEKSGRSMRSVSMQAGLGPGYVHSILKDGKDPTVENLLKVCDELNISFYYLIFGLDMSPEAEEVLLLLEQKPDARAGILQILKAR